MLSYLETNCLDHEGLLRVPGVTTRLSALQQDLEANYNYNPDSCPFEAVKSNDVCSLLKQFIRYNVLEDRERVIMKERAYVSRVVVDVIHNKSQSSANLSSLACFDLKRECKCRFFVCFL